MAGLPFAHERLAFISSGTWSLVGTVIDAPVLTDDARDGGFTNEGGVGGTIRCLTIVVGLWLLQQAVADWRGRGLDVGEVALGEQAAALPPEGPCFDADTDTFLAPGAMVRRMDEALARCGHPPMGDNPVQMTAAIFRSLAKRYAEAIGRASRITGKRFDAIAIAGGGVKHRALTAWTRHATGLEVLEGPSESAALGNAAVQIAALEGAAGGGDLQRIARGFL